METTRKPCRTRLFFSLSSTFYFLFFCGLAGNLFHSLVQALVRFSAEEWGVPVALHRGSTLQMQPPRTVWWTNIPISEGRFWAKQPYSGTRQKGRGCRGYRSRRWTHGSLLHQSRSWNGSTSGWSTKAVGSSFSALGYSSTCWSLPLALSIISGRMIFKLPGSSSAILSVRNPTYIPVIQLEFLFVAIARTAALVLHVDVIFILFPVCRNFVSLLRRTPLNGIIPFDSNITLHKATGWSIVAGTLVHIGSHMVNFYKLAASMSSTRTELIKNFVIANFATGPGATGWIMTIILAIMTFFSSEKQRKANFERFWYSHHLFILFFICWQLHGMFCMIKPDRPPFCSFENIGVFWVCHLFIFLSFVYIFMSISDSGLPVVSSGLLSVFFAKSALVMSPTSQRWSNTRPTSWNSR